MTFFRNLHLRRILSILLLFVALFSQIQLLYACDSMAGEPKHVCCCGEHSSAFCPMATDCSMNEQVEKTSCCGVSYDILNDAGMMSSVSTVDYSTLVLNSPQPPPYFRVLPLMHTPLPMLSQLSPVVEESRIIDGNKETYLLTRRLRL